MAVGVPAVMGLVTTVTEVGAASDPEGVVVCCSVSTVPVAGAAAPPEEVVGVVTPVTVSVAVNVPSCRSTTGARSKGCEWVGAWQATQAPVCLSSCCICLGGPAAHPGDGVDVGRQRCRRRHQVPVRGGTRTQQQQW